jgi:hypothetical protein
VKELTGAPVLVKSEAAIVFVCGRLVGFTWKAVGFGKYGVRVWKEVGVAY